MERDTWDRPLPSSVPHFKGKHRRSGRGSGGQYFRFQRYALSNTCHRGCVVEDTYQEVWILWGEVASPRGLSTPFPGGGR